MENKRSSDKNTLLTELTLLGQNLGLHGAELSAMESGVPAAVIAPLLLPDWHSPRTEAKLLYIKRAESLRQHSGQIAFPGGVMDPGDSNLLSAGFREGLEEVGLQRERARVLAALPAANTPSGYRLQPFFIATTQQEFVAQPSEVESIHFIALEELLECPVRVEFREWQGTTHRVIYFDTSSVCIWGITGRITEILLQHFFAWQAPQ